MRYAMFVVSLVAVASLAACSSPQDRAAKAQQESYEAQEEVARQRLELVDKYQDCVKDAAGDAVKADACESYLRAAEALK
jgi:outer membrane biogenesis lipoprotein LolB